MCQSVMSDWKRYQRRINGDECYFIYDALMLNYFIYINIILSSISRDMLGTWNRHIQYLGYNMTVGTIVGIIEVSSYFSLGISLPLTLLTRSSSYLTHSTSDRQPWTWGQITSSVSVWTFRFIHESNHRIPIISMWKTRVFMCDWTPSFPTLTVSNTISSLPINFPQPDPLPPRIHTWYIAYF